MYTYKKINGGFGMSTVFEEKNNSKAILRIALPAMLGQLTTLIYNIADTYFVSLTNNPAQIAAVTLCTPILLIIMSVACVFGMGGSSVIARFLGEGKRDEAHNVFYFATLATTFVSLVVLILGLIFIFPIANAIGVDATNRSFTCDYLRYIFLGAPFIMLANGFVHLFRSIGLIKQGTIGLALGNAVNIILDYVFIILLDMGTVGAALATSAGFFFATIYYFGCTFNEAKKGNTLVTFSLHSCKIEGKLIRDVVSIGIPGSFITVLMSVSNIVLNNFIGIYGSDAVASYGIAYKIDMVPIMLSVGLSQGVAPLIGYCFGAKQTKRMSKMMILSSVYGIILGCIFTVLFLIFSIPLSSIFMKDDTLIRQTAYFLRILSLSAPMLGIINMVSSYYQALGKAISSLIITLLRNIILFIPGVMLLNQFMQLDGVIAAQPIVETILMFICMIMYLYSEKKISVLNNL